MQDNLATHGTTIDKLRKLLGIEKSSEKHSDLVDKPKVAKKNKSTKPKEKEGDDFTAVKPKVTIHPLEEL
jgi:transposase